MNSHTRPRDSTEGRGANSASIVCAPPAAVLALPAGFALAGSACSNALVSRPRSFIRAMNCCCSSGDMPLKRSIICAGSNPRPPPAPLKPRPLPDPAATCPAPAAAPPPVPGAVLDGAGVAFDREGAAAGGAVAGFAPGGAALAGPAGVGVGAAAPDAPAPAAL